MSKEELGRLTVIQGAIDGKYTAGYTAKRPGISERHVKRLKRAVRDKGAGAVIHGNSGRHSANYKDDELRRRIIGLKQSGVYAETNFTYFRELLLERENITIGYTTLCGILKGAGIESKKKHRREGKKFRRRNRRGAFGEMLQADATPFDWFGSGMRQSLHGFIDDVTGRLVGLYRCQNEILGSIDYSKQTNQKMLQVGEPHPDRNVQFEHINNTAAKYIKADDPVISVDTKKKENIGNFRNSGQEYRHKKEPRKVLGHDFLVEELGEISPYGVYNLNHCL